MIITVFLIIGMLNVTDMSVAVLLMISHLSLKNYSEGMVHPEITVSQGRKIHKSRLLVTLLPSAWLLHASVNMWFSPLLDEFPDH